MQTIRVLLLGLLLAVAAISGPALPAMADRAYLEEFRQAASRALGTGKDQAQVVLARYGQPDLHDTRAYDQPRPALVSRWLDHQRAGVRVVFLANGSVDKPPPYTWTLIGFTDIPLNEAISFEDGDRRLRAARR